MATTTITIRVRDTQKAELEAAARDQGISLSDYVRGTLALREQELARVDGNVQAILRRLDRLEEIAGL